MRKPYGCQAVPESLRVYPLKCPPKDEGKMSAIVAIPARLKSTRFPRKVLADIHGRPMLWYVFQGVSKAKRISAVWVLTDSTEVLQVASSWGGRRP